MYQKCVAQLKLDQWMRNRRLSQRRASVERELSGHFAVAVLQGRPSFEKMVELAQSTEGHVQIADWAVMLPAEEPPDA